MWCIPGPTGTCTRDVAWRGCLLSEFPPGTPPIGRNFPRRNRIISGLTCGVVVVEAPARSGALITAQLALDQGRDVFAVPGNVDAACSAGSNGLLREGAIVVQHGWDVMEEYQALFPDKVHPWTGQTALSSYPRGVGGTAGSRPGTLSSLARRFQEIQKKRLTTAAENRIVNQRS